MNTSFCFKAALLGPVILGLGSYSWSVGDDLETQQQLTLVDLAGYRAALSGKATAEDPRAGDPPARVVFKDVWNRPDLFRGRRVTVQGRIVRVFRQGPVGSFPPLAEVWIASPSGDPFCLVFPQPGPIDGNEQKRGTTVEAMGDHEQDTVAEDEKDVCATPIPELGRTIRFTGTFLKMVRYAAGDGARLAPLVVGDLLPVLIPAKAAGSRSSAESVAAVFRAINGGSHAGASIEWRTWAVGLTLAALVAGALAWRQIRAPSRRSAVRHAGRRTTSRLVLDPPLEFIEPRDDQ
ncbi:MAG: hypothetical protein ACHRXM_39435 [Isosphaerales bacterium]